MSIETQIREFYEDKDYASYETAVPSEDKPYKMIHDIVESGERTVCIPHVMDVICRITLNGKEVDPSYIVMGVYVNVAFPIIATACVYTNIMLATNTKEARHVRIYGWMFPKEHLATRDLVVVNHREGHIIRTTYEGGNATTTFTSDKVITITC